MATASAMTVYDGVGNYGHDDEDDDDAQSPRESCVALSACRSSCAMASA
jgi:hypothetical protein